MDAAECTGRNCGLRAFGGRYGGLVYRHLGLGEFLSLLAMDPVPIGRAVDHDHAAVMQEPVENGGRPEMVVEIIPPKFSEGMLLVMMLERRSL